MSVSLIGRIVGMAFLSGARPFLTMAMAQTVILLAVYANWISLHPDYGVLLSWPVIGVVFALAVVELVVAHDEHADEVKRMAQLDKVGAVAATAYGTLLMFAIGEPVPEAISGFSATAATLTASAPEVATLVERATGSTHPFWVQATAVVVAASFTLGLSWIRSWILEWLTDVGLHGAWHVVETGGLPLAVVLVLFAPVFMLAIAVLATGLMVVLAVGARAWQRHADELARVPCAHCGKQVRIEASLCPHCRSTVVPQKWLGQQPEPTPAPAPVV